MVDVRGYWETASLVCECMVNIKVYWNVVGLVLYQGGGDLAIVLLE